MIVINSGNARQHNFYSDHSIRISMMVKVFSEMGPMSYSMKPHKPMGPMSSESVGKVDGRVCARHMGAIVWGVQGIIFFRTKPNLLAV